MEQYVPPQMPDTRPDMRQNASLPGRSWTFRYTKAIWRGEPFTGVTSLFIIVHPYSNVKASRNVKQKQYFTHLMPLAAQNGWKINIYISKEQNAYGATQENYLSGATSGLAFWSSVDCNRPNGNQTWHGIRTSAGALLFLTFIRP